MKRNISSSSVINHSVDSGNRECEGHTFNDAPRIATAADFTAVDFDDRVGADDGEGDSVAQAALLFALLLVVHVGELVNLDLVLSNLVQDLARQTSRCASS